MLKVDAQTSTLVMIDFQSKLVPVIDQGATVVENARRLIVAASLLAVDDEGRIVEYALSPGSIPVNLVGDPSNQLWFTRVSSGSIGTLLSRAT